jgi:hypothetical protein
MSQLFVDNIKGRTGGAIGAPSGAVVTGIVTATTFKGNVEGTTGTFTGNVSIGGTLTYEDVANIDSVGVITARLGIRVGAGQSIGSDGAAVVYYGDGSNLGGVVSGVETKEGGTSKGTSQVSLNFTGATVTSAGTETTVAIASAGLTTEASVVSGAVVTLDLSNAQDHKVTATGSCTITCSGGVEGESHTVRIINNGSATIGFSTYFLFPSGSTPSLPSADGSINLISFTVNRVGVAGTQLLTGASVNFS